MGGEGTLRERSEEKPGFATFPMKLQCFSLFFSEQKLSRHREMKMMGTKIEWKAEPWYRVGTNFKSETHIRIRMESLL